MIGISELLANDPLTAGIAAEIRAESNMLNITPDTTRLYREHLDNCGICEARGVPCERALRLILPPRAVRRILDAATAIHRVDVIYETMKRKTTAELLAIDAEGLDGRWHQAARRVLDERLDGGVE